MGPFLATTKMGRRLPCRPVAFILAKRARVAVQGRVALQPTQPAFFLPAAVFVFAALFSIASAPTAPRRRVDEPVAPLRDIEKGPGTGKKEGKGLTLYT